MRWLAVAMLLVTLPLNATLIVSAFRPAMEWPRPLAAVYAELESFRIVNGYGLFRVMTRSRPEIVVEGSADGKNWQPYEFRWKPGEVSRPPRWVAPYQPRLDWQMWFAALGTYTTDRWFVPLAERLLRNEPAVTALLAGNPFAERPPKFVRASLYDYRFTTKAERARSGESWHRDPRGEYLPVVSLPDG